VLQLIHEANVEKLLVKNTLRMREIRIAELETEVEALNKVTAAHVYASNLNVVNGKL